MFGQIYKMYKDLENYKFMMEIPGVSNELKTNSIQLNSFIQCLMDTVGPIHDYWISSNSSYVKISITSNGQGLWIHFKC